MDLRLLRTLADNGEPLSIRTEKRDGYLWVGRDGGELVKFVRDDQNGLDGMRGMKLLEQVLAHYPREVRVDGAVMPTAAEPRAARVMVLEPEEGNTVRRNFQDLRRTVAPFLNPRFNTLAGGVCCYIRNPMENGEKSSVVYLSRMDRQDDPRHRMLAAVKIQPHTVIPRDELGGLVEGRGEMIEVPRGSRLEERTAEAHRQMCRDTEALEGVPPRYEGDVYLHPLIGECGNDQTYTGGPVEVTGRPVWIDQSGEDLTDAQVLSVVDALRWNGSGMVPVGQRGCQLPGMFIPGKTPDTAITGVEFSHDGEEQGLGGVEGITLKMTVTVSDGTEGGTQEEIEMPARVHLGGEFEDEASCRAVLGTITQGELQDILVRAYWREEEWHSWDEMEYQHEMLQERMGNLARHILGDPEGAMLAEMEARVNRIFPNLPVPDRELSTTSRDGRWTLTLNGAAERKAA